MYIFYCQNLNLEFNIELAIVLNDLFLTIMCMCIYVWIYIHMGKGALRGQKMALDPLVLE